MFNKVHIIDDDEISIFLTETLLDVEQFAKEYKGFLSAQDALDDLVNIVEQKNFQQLPDLLFLDLNMPFMSGWDFLDALSPYEQELLNKCHIFILTSSVDTVELERAKKYKLVAGFLQKPLEEGVFEKIKNLL